jgi:hypothetical protein
VLALPQAAGVGGDRLGRRGPFGDRSFVLWVAHAHGRELAQGRLQIGPEFRGDLGPQVAQPVGILRPQDQPAEHLAPIDDVLVVGFGPVGIEQLQE